MEEGIGIKSYRDLVVWQKSLELVTDVYAITKGFQKEEIYALTSQIRRSAVSDRYSAGCLAESQE